MNRAIVRNTLVFLVAAGWLAMMFLLIDRHYPSSLGPSSFGPSSLGFSFLGGKSTSPPLSISTITPGEDWMGVYFKGDRIGSLHRVLQKEESGYRLAETMHLSLTIMDYKKEVDTVTTAEMDSNLGLKSFNFTLRADAPFHVSGKVDGNRLTVIVEALGRRSESSLTLVEQPSFNIPMAAKMLRNDIRPGLKRTATIFDPSSMKQQKIELEVVGDEIIEAMGQSRKAHKIKGSLMSSDFFVWISDSGEVLREESPLGFVLVKETAADSKKVISSRDMAEQSAVPFHMKLPDMVSYLKMRVSGAEIRQLDLDGGRQHLTGDILEIRREDISSAGRKQEGTVSDEYLRDTFFISSHSAKIIALAKDIVKREKEPLKKARLIHEWVFRNIEKVPAITLPVADEVLDKRRGDCNEHATLFTALARAAGVPARMALGLVYASGSFYYHAWPEIYAGQWIAVDPTLGQFPADASHIRLITGDIDKQGRLMALLGKIKLEGIEYR